jgi:hypothetical protein
MSHIVLTPEQLRVVKEAAEPVEVRDDQGKVLAKILAPLDAIALEHYRKWRTNPQQGIPAAVVEARMKRLEEISQREALTPERVRDLLARMQAGEEV